MFKAITASMMAWNLYLLKLAIIRCAQR